MEMTLLTVVYAGLQTACGYRGRVRHLLVCPKQRGAWLFKTLREHQKDNTSEARSSPDLIRARYYLERQTSVSPNRLRCPGVLA